MSEPQVYNSTNKPGIQYQLGKLLGEGAEGQVYQGTTIPTNEKVAIKLQFSMVDIKLQSLERLVGQEFKHIIKIKDLIKTSVLSGVVMELAEGNFIDYMKTGRQIKDGEKQIVLLIDGVSELHAMNLIHRDLKPSNVVYFKQGQQLTLKLCDFGLVREYNPQMTLKAGTLLYLAPERLIYAHLIWYLMIVGDTMINEHKGELQIENDIYYLKDKEIIMYINKSGKFDEVEKEILQKIISINQATRLRADELKKQLESIIKRQIVINAQVDNLLINPIQQITNYDDSINRYYEANALQKKPILGESLKVVELKEEPINQQQPAIYPDVDKVNLLIQSPIPAKQIQLQFYVEFFDFLHIEQFDMTGTVEDISLFVRNNYGFKENIIVISRNGTDLENSQKLTTLSEEDLLNVVIY